VYLTVSLPCSSISLFQTNPAREYVANIKILCQLKAISGTGFLTQRSRTCKREVSKMNSSKTFLRRGFPATTISTSIGITSMQSSGHAQRAEIASDAQRVVRPPDPCSGAARHESAALRRDDLRILLGVDSLSGDGIAIG
jgi:hypothetical protein